jgi:5-methylthioribose kinase
LQDLALRTKDLALKQKIERLGSLYLSKGSIYCTGITIRKLVKTADGSKVIDPEFCFMACANLI